LEWLKESDLQIPKKAEAVYFVGCLDAYRYPKTALKTYTLLNKMGVGLLKDEKCCGSPILRLGFNAGDLMKHNADQIKKIGAETIITGCAGCYNTLKNNYSLMGCQIVTVSEYLAANLKDLKKTGFKKLNLKVTYHDPCHSGRHNRVFDEPRQIIREICGTENFLEMKNIREKSRCCGGGGGVRSGYTELSISMAKKRIEDAPKGVDYIVTTCPLCLRNLKDANGSIPVIDLIELVSMALEK
jgi:Fe-S oxidoreductase